VFRYVYCYTRSMEQRYYQLHSTSVLAHRLSSFLKDRTSDSGQDLVGVVFDLIKIPRKDIARAVSIRRQVAMKTVVVRSGVRFTDFRRREGKAWTS